MGRMARRAGDIDGEEQALLSALAAAEDGALRAAVRLSLAKLYEHRRRDLQSALEHAAETALAEGDEAADRRIARLRRRLARLS